MQGFVLAVDDDVSLLLPEPRFAEPLAALVAANREHLDRFEDWAAELSDVAAARAMLSRSLTRFGTGQAVPALVVVGGAPAGWVSLRVDGDTRSATVGYWLDAASAGRGIATRAVSALCRFGFDGLGLARISAELAVANGASRALLRRVGFRHEGLLRAAQLVRGTVQDTELWSLLPEELAPPAGGDAGQVRGFALAVDDGLALVPCEARHADRLAALVAANTAHLRRFDPWAAGLADPAAAREALTSSAASFAAGGSVPTLLVADEELAGMLALRIDRAQSSASMGYWLAAACTGRGLMTRAVTAVARLGFAEHGLVRISADVEPDNSASRGVLTRVGFRREAVRRRAQQGPGIPGDLELWSLLPGDLSPAG